MAKVILFESDVTDFSTRGLGVLKDIENAIISEKINGIYDMSFFYPLDGRLYEEIKEERIVYAKGPKNYQAFRIISTEKNDLLDGINVRAMHISYDLAGNFVEDTFIQNKGGDGAIKQLLSKAVLPHKFIGTSNISKTFNSRLVRENVLTALLGTDDNSFINRAGGQFERDNFRINWLNRIGQDRGVKIKYKKNLTGLNFKIDYSSVVTRVMPQGFDTLFLPEKYVDSELIRNYSTINIRKIKFDSIKSKKINKDDKDAIEHDKALELLRMKSREYLKANDKPKITCDVSFVDLSQTVEYAQYKNLETVYIGDTITIEHKPLKIDFKKQMTAYTYDSVEERYIFITLGEEDGVISGAINIANNALSKVNELQETLEGSLLDKYKQVATDLINNGFGGYTKYYKDRMLVMDTDDEATATKVWQFNKNGIGYSSTGIQGPYKYAWTIDGVFNTDFIGANSITVNQLRSDVGQSLDLSSNESINLEVDKKIKNNNSKIEKQFNSKISQTSNEITQSVSSKINDVKSEIAISTSAQIKASTDGINLEFNKKFENLQIGAVNMALESRYTKNDLWFGYQLTKKKITTISDTSDGWNGFKQLTFTNFKDSGDGSDFNLACAYSLHKDSTFDEGREYVISFLAKNYREFPITFWMNGFKKTDRVTLPGGSTRKIILRATKGNAKHSQIAVSTHKFGYNVKFAIAELMVEKGTIPSQWRIAPSERVNKDNVISSINLSEEGVKIRAKNIELDGDTVAKSLTSKKIYGTVIEGSTINGSKIKIGDYGFLQPARNSLQINVPDTEYSRSGVAMQIHGKERTGNVPAGVFIYRDDDFTSGGTFGASAEDLLTVAGYIKAAFTFDDKWYYGYPIMSNQWGNHPIGGNLYPIRFIGYDTDSSAVYFTDGNSGANSTWWVTPDSTSSDIRLKFNIKESNQDCLDLISKINFKSFDWKKDGFGKTKKHTNTGIIADELELLDDSLVYTHNKDEEKTKYIDDFRLLAVTTKAVQELNKKVEELELKIKQLEER